MGTGIRWRGGKDRWNRGGTVGGGKASGRETTGRRGSARRVGREEIEGG